MRCRSAFGVRTEVGLLVHTSTVHGKYVFNVFGEGTRYIMYLMYIRISLYLEPPSRRVHDGTHVHSSGV